jgi:hypothetical protein
LKLTAKSKIRDVAITVSNALAASGIRATLSGGACASIYSGGVYQSSDLDFILQSRVSGTQLDEAMSAAGFQRKGVPYLHSSARFYVEFPPGPLSIGSDYQIVPIERKFRGGALLTLSATDSCRDRLAGFFHWNDRPGFRAAVHIALRNRVDMKAIRDWSLRERALPRFEQFAEEVRKRRRRLPKSASSARPRLRDAATSR